MEFETRELLTDADIQHWLNVKKSQTSWERDKKAVEEEYEWARRNLRTLFSQNHGELVEALKKSPVVEVVLSMPEDSQKETPWDWIIPWEFLLTSVFDIGQASRGPIIIRTFDQTGPPQSQGYSERKALLTVLSNPGPIKEHYSDTVFQIEQHVMEENLGLTTNESLPDATRQKLEEKIQRIQPWAVNLICIDGHQAAGITGDSDLDKDGIILGSVELEHVPPELFAGTLCSGDYVSEILGCNLYYSNLLAAWAVKSGIRTAVGFDSWVDDISAENFFADFYLALNLCESQRVKDDVLESFRLAFDNQVRGSTGLRTSVVLYSRASLLKTNGQFQAISEIKSRSLTSAFNKKRDDVAEAGKGKVEVSWIKPCRELNYAMLHNNRSIFESFGLLKTPALKKLENIKIEVTLYAGSEQARYEHSGCMRYSYWPIQDEIRVPLTSGLLRTSRSTIITSIVVRVTYDGKEAYLNTHRVKLLPIDQWQDDDTNRKWLPSFVFSGDRAVRRVIDEGQRYLSALSDNISAGFSGYQEALSDSAPPFESVDNQVRAMWWALINELPLNYVNPPPTYGINSQRVRTPSDVLESKRGTCLDLALFLAACLEYVDLRPVIFLLHGHAFPGYFRTEDAHNNLRKNLSTVTEDKAIWMFSGNQSYRLVLDMVGEGSLVPLETLVLNQRGGFWEAVEQGGINLRAPGAFQHLVDIRTARDQDVTPLPIEEAQ